MMLKFAFCLMWPLSCQLTPSTYTKNSEVQGLSHPNYANQFANIKGIYTIGDGDSINRLRNLTTLDRALITVSADRAATSELTDWQPIKIPYVKVPQDALSLKTEVQQSDLRQAGDYSYENLAAYFSTIKNEKSCSMIIPYHPDTVNKPPLVEKFASSPNRGYFSLHAFRSMSRSLFVINNELASNKMPLLFSIKMGTDTVKSVPTFRQRQDSKLLGLQEHVDRVNRFGKTTSILKLAQEEGILLLNDSVGLNFFEKSSQHVDDTKNNGIIIRSYDSLLEDRDRIYMPLEKYLFPTLVLNNESKEISVWNLHNGPFGRIAIQFSQEDLTRMTKDLTLQYGKLMAIYYLNGYTSRDLHGQNLLVGVPLDPKLSARIAVRDLSDHAEFPFAANGAVSKVLNPFPRIYWNKMIVSYYGIGTHHFNLNFGQSIESLVMEGFRSVESRLIKSLNPSQQALAPEAKDYQSFYETLYPLKRQDMLDFVKLTRAYKPTIPPTRLLLRNRPAIPKQLNCLSLCL